METSETYQDYLDELRASVCIHCIQRLPGNPPCTLHGNPCGIEQHLPELVEICRTTESNLMDPYLEQLHDKICVTCENRDQPSCPCPLSYILQLAVEAVDRVNAKRKSDNPETRGTSISCKC